MLPRRKILHQQLLLGFIKYNFQSWSVVFFGSDSFSVAQLKCLHEQMEKKVVKTIEVVVVNEANPVYIYAVSNYFKTHLWPPNLNGTYDFGVIASFGKFIPRNILLQFPLGILNVHGSLLPKWRGGMPVVHAILNGDASTGVTITKIRHDKWDAGEIILQKSCEIGKNEIIPSVMKKLSNLGRECLTEVISNMPDILNTSWPQSDEQASLAPKLKKEAAIINWSEMTALEIFNRFRSLFGTYELRSTWQGKPVKFVCLFLSDANKSFSVNKKDIKPEPGRFIFEKKTGFLIVQCKDRTIDVCSIKYNKKLHTGDSFYKGYLHKSSESLWKFGS